MTDQQQQEREALRRIEQRAQELADRGGKIDALEFGAIAEEARASLAVQPAAVPARPVEPFVVKHYTSEDRPIIKGNGFDGLAVGEDREEAENFVAWLNAALACQRAGVENVQPPAPPPPDDPFEDDDGCPND